MERRGIEPDLRIANALVSRFLRRFSTLITLPPGAQGGFLTFFFFFFFLKKKKPPRS